MTLKKLSGILWIIVLLSANLFATNADKENTPNLKRPNVLFIITDQQYAEIMSHRMGRQFLHTPSIDRIAESGMLFTRAYTANPLCKPARTAIFSGRYPHETGAQTNEYCKLDAGIFPCLSTYLRDSGYKTGYVGKWHICYDKNDKEIHGFDFTDVLYHNGHDREIPEPAAKFILEKGEEPFFLVVSFSNPHDMCELARYQELPSGAIDDPRILDQYPPLRKNHLPSTNEADAITLVRESYHNTTTFPLGQYSEEQWRRLIWGYYRLVEKVDTLIGEVLDALDQSGQRDNTIIIFTSDHGDCHGAHKFNQKTLFYEESSRVPLIISYKGEIEQGVSDKLVNTGIDILPTILDYAEISKPDQLPGRSLRKVTEGEDESNWREYVVVQNYMIQGGPVNGVTPKIKGRMVRSEHYKYCVYDTGLQRESLFDMENDPGEMVNIAYKAGSKQIIEQHRNYLKEHSKKYSDNFEAIPDPK